MSELDWEQLLRDGLDAYNRGEWDAVLPYAALDIELQRAPTSPEAGTLVRGREQVVEFFRPDALSEQQLDMLEFHEGAGAFLAKMRFSAKGAGSGLPVELIAFIVYRVEGERVTRIEIYNEEADGRRAAGVDPPSS